MHPCGCRHGLGSEPRLKACRGRYPHFGMTEFDEAFRGDVYVVVGFSPELLVLFISEGR